VVPTKRSKITSPGPTGQIARPGLLIGYARCSTDTQDLTAQRDALAGLGVAEDRVYVDHGLTGTNRARPGLREALAAGRAGVTMNSGGSGPHPRDPIGRLLFNVLAMIAEFESDLARMRTREGMKVARAKGRLRGKQPKLKPSQEAHLIDLWRAGEHTSAELAELFGVGRSTVYRAIKRAEPAGAGG